MATAPEPLEAPPTDERLGIAGAGVIACGLAIVAAARGPVAVWSRSEAGAARATARVQTLCERLDAGPAGANVTCSSDRSVLDGTTFVVEAIAEDAAAKASLHAELAGRLDPSAVLATTTSSLPVGALAAASGVPERFAALHVFNPVPKMELVELSFPPEATPDTRARVHALCAALEKTAVEVPDVPGFVVNRLLFPYLFAAVRMLEETGLSPQAIDDCMRLGAGHPLGPLALLDLVGLDVSAAIGRSIGAEVPDRIEELVADGALGRKAGRGFHAY